MQLSFWERTELTHYDYVVVGAGFVGMHIALQLRNKEPHAKIVIVEQGLLPSGASTKNAGFACMGSATELRHDLSVMSPNEVCHLFEMRYKGLQYTRQLLGDDAIGYQQHGSYELLYPSVSISTDELDELNKLVFSITNCTSFSHNKEIIQQSGFNSNTFSSAINNHCEGALNTGMLVQALHHLCLQKSIAFNFGTTVAQLDCDTSGVRMLWQNNTHAFEVRAQQCFIATNAFATQLLPQLNLVPGRGLVLVTKPINDLKIRGIFHVDEGYYYFRSINNRVLFGGGRNFDFATEQSNQFEINTKIEQRLRTMLAEDILPNTPHEVDYLWTGIMAFDGSDSSSKLPIVQQVAPNCYCAVRCGGMGVAMAPIMAQQCVALQ